MQRAAVILLAMVFALAALACNSGENHEQEALPPLPSDQPEQAADSESQINRRASKDALGVEEEDLVKAAKAYIAIQALNEELQEAVQQTQDMEERQRLIMASNQQMVLATEEVGLDFEAYDDIMHKVRTNRTTYEIFHEKVQAMK
jgi:hypothetical protein